MDVSVIIQLRGMIIYLVIENMPQEPMQQVVFLYIKSSPGCSTEVRPLRGPSHDLYWSAGPRDSQAPPSLPYLQSIKHKAIQRTLHHKQVLRLF